MKTLTLKVPPPPTTNNLYFNRTGKGRIKTGVYRSWQEHAAWSNCKAKRETFGRVAIEISVPTDRRRDLDNYLKPLCDLLQSMGIVKNDNQIDDLRIRRGEGAECIVEIREL